MHALNAGRVSALVRLVGNKFQEEMVLGTNEYKKTVGVSKWLKNHIRLASTGAKVQKLMKEKRGDRAELVM